MRVLVTDAQHHQTLAITRYLGRRGVEVHAINTNPRNPRPMTLYSKYCKQEIQGPRSSDPEFFNFLLGLLERTKYDLFIPVSYDANRLASEHRNRLSECVVLEIVDFDTLSTAADRMRLYDLAGKVGVPIPRTVFPKQIKNISSMACNLNFPIVVKGRYEQGGGSVFGYFNTVAELTSFYRTLGERQAQADSLPMIQEYIPSRHNNSFTALYQEGECKRVFMFKEIRSYPVMGGSGTYSESIYDPQLKECGLRLLDALHWHGLAHVEMKRDSRDGELKLLEINPKIWASVDIAMRAGVDFASSLCSMAQGLKLDYSEEYRRGLRFHWPSLEYQHFKSNPEALPDILRAFVDPRVRSNIWITDPKPNLMTGFLMLVEEEARLRARILRMIANLASR